MKQNVIVSMITLVMYSSLSMITPVLSFVSSTRTYDYSKVLVLEYSYTITPSLVCIGLYLQVIFNNLINRTLCANFHDCYEYGRGHLPQLCLQSH